MFEDDHKHKQVVNAEGKFNDVTGQPLQTDLRGGAAWRDRAVFFHKLAACQHAWIGVEPTLAHPPEKHVERQRKRGPHDHAGQRGFPVDHFCVAMEHA